MAENLSYADMQFWLSVLQGLEIDIPSAWRINPVSLKQVFAYLDKFVPIRFRYSSCYKSLLITMGWEYRAFCLPNEKHFGPIIEAYNDHQELTTTELLALTEFVQKDKKLRDVFWSHEYFDRAIVYDVFHEHAYFTTTPNVPFRLEVLMPRAIPLDDLYEFFHYFHFFILAPDPCFIPTSNLQDAAKYLCQFRNTFT
jgi:hypothetical protein